MIKRIELKNFMSHTHTVIEPAAGLTVLTGPNNCGKSAVVAALQILCHNDNSTYVLKHEEKNCEISVETREGHSVQWSRKKNGSPKYEINGKAFDRLKGGVPAELHKALRLGRVASEKSEFDVHIGEQKKPIFLLNDSPRAAAEFFASSSDAIRLVEMQGLHKAKVRDAKKDKVRLDAEILELESSLEALEPVGGLSKKLEKCEKAFYEINLSESEYETLGKKISKIEWLMNQINFLEQQECVLNQLQPVPVWEDSDRLERCLNSLVTVSTERERLEHTVACMQMLEQPPELDDEVRLADQIEQIENSQLASKVLHEKSFAFGKLNPLPAFEIEQGLESLVLRLEAALGGTQQLCAQAEMLFGLEVPPSISEPEELVTLISRLENGRKVIRSLEQELQSIHVELTCAGESINEWVAENPTCPTCRRPMGNDMQVSLGHQCEGDSDG